MRALRTVRSTTDKHGRWCKPKCSTYSDDVICVVTHPEMPPTREAAWLFVGRQGIYLHYANCKESKALALPPCHGRPRREPEKVRLVSHKPMSILEIAEGKAMEVDHITEYENPADPPELCDAYDLWTKEIKTLKGMVLFKLMELSQAQIQAS